MNTTFRRPAAALLEQRLGEAPPKRLQILAGPRQVGKTTLVTQVMEARPLSSWRFLRADDPLQRATLAAEDDATWLSRQWIEAEVLALRWQQSGHPQAALLPFVLVIDEVQGLKDWSATIKGLWDGALARGASLHVVLLGSAPLLVQKGLNEALTGRYELIRVPHWSFAEMNEAFGFSFEQFAYFGGYPGSAPFIADEARWRAYVLDALVEPSIEKDVVAMARVDKPAMLRRLFELGCAYSAQILALSKVSATLGQGHELTLAHHLSLLGQAGLLTGLSKYAHQVVRQRGSPPKFQVLNNALLSVRSAHDFAAAQADRSHWGRLIESMVGVHLLNSAEAGTRIHYWRESPHEVDFVIEHHGRLAAIEVKSQVGHVAGTHRGLAEFAKRHLDARCHLVGSDELPVAEFLMRPAAEWTR
jgi:predicted AAA+ superfamily ATPase